jgi:hypothetical protein
MENQKHWKGKWHLNWNRNWEERNKLSPYPLEEARTTQGRTHARRGRGAKNRAEKTIPLLGQTTRNRGGPGNPKEPKDHHRG